MSWLKGTRDGIPVFVRAEPLPRGRLLFVEQKGGAWTAYSARAWLDEAGTDATPKDVAWCDKVVFIASGGAGSSYFDTW